MTNNPELALLQTLSDAAPYLVKERQLAAETNNRMTRMLTPDEFTDVLRAAKDRRRVDGVEGEDGAKWKITDDGFARLNELRRTTPRA